MRPNIRATVVGRAGVGPSIILDLSWRGSDTPPHGRARRWGTTTGTVLARLELPNDLALLGSARAAPRRAPGGRSRPPPRRSAAGARTDLHRSTPAAERSNPDLPARLPDLWLHVSERGPVLSRPHRAIERSRGADLGGSSGRRR